MRTPGGGGDGVDQRRRTGGAARLADAAGRFAARDDVHLDHRRLVDPHHAIVVEIGLLNPAILDRDVAIERGGAAEDHSALHLRRQSIGIDHPASIHHRGDALEMDFARFVHCHFGHGGDIGAESELGADAPALPRRQLRAPARLLRHLLQRLSQPRALVQMRQAEGDGILARFQRQLVHQAFAGEDGVVGRDAAPPAHPQRARARPRHIRCAGRRCHRACPSRHPAHLRPRHS